MFKKLFFSLIIIFLSMELLLHLIQEKLSIDIQHYNQMDNITLSLSEKEKNNFLFLGNSLTRRGVNKELIKAEFQNSSVAYIYPDDTSITEWFWVIKSKVLSKTKTNTIAISFADGQLKDKKLKNQQLVRISSIISSSDFSDVIEFESLNFTDTTKLFLGHYSKIFALQERINNRILGFLPHYRDTMQTINKSLRKEAISIESDHKTSYKHLKQIIQLCNHNNIKLIIIAMPVPHKYHLDEQLIKLKKARTFQFIDARSIESVNENDYLDGYHLNPEGSIKFTKFLTENLINKNL